jgi:hypothetical protein
VANWVLDGLDEKYSQGALQASKPAGMVKWPPMLARRLPFPVFVLCTNEFFFVAIADPFVA